MAPESISKNDPSDIADYDYSHAAYKGRIPPVTPAVPEPGDQPVSDAVNHPSHYNNHPSGVECIDIIEWFTHNIGNSMGYLWRAGDKTEDPTEDYKKAIWYIRREMKRLGLKE